MIRTLIIEDEVPAAQRLQKLLAEVEPSIRVVGILESVSSAVQWFKENPQPDLLMLDIQLADGLSFDIIKKVRIESFVIFTTAYDEYAIKAFELNSVDYLLKPVDRTKLQKAIGKLERIRGQQWGVDINKLMETLELSRKKFKERFVVNLGASIKTIETRNIAYFYSLDKNTFLCTGEDRHYPVDPSLDKLDELLDPDHFFRINRQYTLNFQAIEKIRVLSRSRVAIHTVPPTEEPLLVSTARAHQFRKWLDR